VPVSEDEVAAMGMDEMVFARLADVDSLAAKVVYLVIASHVNGDGVAYPSVQLLAKESHLSRRSVFRAVNELKDKELLTVDSQPGRVSLFKLSTDRGDTRSPVTHGHPGVTQTTQRGDTRSPRKKESTYKEKSDFKSRELDEIHRLEAELAGLRLAAEPDHDTIAEVSARLRVLLDGGES
jgi:DNA-binding transcriptional MocR family regulator